MSWGACIGLYFLGTAVTAVAFCVVFGWAESQDSRLDHAAEDEAHEPAEFVHG